MKALPPGTLLQFMYLKERLNTMVPGRFLEIGPGSGEITQLLLNLGWVGMSLDLEEITIDRLKVRFKEAILAGQYQAMNQDFLLLDTAVTDPVDLVISCMVLEHLEDPAEKSLMHHAAGLLKANGKMITLVPASPRHWGIEDDIAGHCRRYTYQGVQELMAQTGWKLEHLAGLTYPVSNILLPLSNFLVRRAENMKLHLSPIERTKQSGRREVQFKTHFPFLLGLLLNPVVIWPLHCLQKCFQRSPNALVIYFEARP